MSTLKIILASTRPGSSGPAIGHWVADAAWRSGDFEQVEILDLAQIRLPFLDEPHHPRLGNYTLPHTLAWSSSVGSADALVIVTPEYNSAFPAPLKNALDFLHAEWRDKALGIVTYGGGASGGAGAAATLKPITWTLGLVTAEHSVPIARAAGQITHGRFAGTAEQDLALGLMLTEVSRIDAELTPRRRQLAKAG